MVAVLCTLIICGSVLAGMALFQRLFKPTVNPKYGNTEALEAAVATLESRLNEVTNKVTSLSVKNGLGTLRKE